MGADQFFAEVDESGKPRGWKYVPTEPLIQIFEFLGYRDLGRCCQVCKRWNELGNISYLWEKRFRKDFSLLKNICLHPAAQSWKQEYERVTDHVPSIEFERISEHRDEVLHVAFSNNGMMFCTCSKDATVKVFNADWPFETVFSDSLGRMSLFGWSYTQFSAFSPSDSQLLVAGRYEGSNVGEVVVYNIFSKQFTLQARIRIQPYDIMGCWLNEAHILSSKCHTLTLRRQCLSEILLNKSSQGVENLRQSTVSRLFMFANDYMNAVSYLRVVDMTKVMRLVYKSIAAGSGKDKIHKMHISAYADHLGFSKQKQSRVPMCSTHYFTVKEKHADSSSTLSDELMIPQKTGAQMQYSEAGCHDCSSSACPPCIVEKLPCSGDSKCSASCSNSPLNTDDESAGTTTEEELSIDIAPLKSYKLMAAFTGSESTFSHQIGLKRITQEECEDVQRREIASCLPNTRIPSTNNPLDRPDIKTDSWDNLIDVGGHLVGMVASPCGRYLYASYRKFEQQQDELQRPAISSKVTISMYDLISMDKVMVIEGPSAKSDIFYLYLSCDGQYLASGSEDNQGYLWDRHYRSLLSTFRHDNVVNCVAVNPRDSSMAVSVSDDNLIKIWRSKSFHRLLRGVRAKARNRTSSSVSTNFNKNE